MRSRRMACLLLGLWLGAGLWMQWVASENLASTESLLERPSAAATAYLKTLGPVSIIPLARYLAAEQNRRLYETWGVVQIIASVGFLFLLLFGTRLGKIPLALALLLCLVAIGERLVVIPQLQLAADFGAEASHRARLLGQALNYGFSVAELTKWVLALAVAAFLIGERSGRSLHSRHEVDVVDKPNYGHIDR